MIKLSLSNLSWSISDLFLNNISFILLLFCNKASLSLSFCSYFNKYKSFILFASSFSCKFLSLMSLYFSNNSFNFFISDIYILSPQHSPLKLFFLAPIYLFNSSFSLDNICTWFFNSLFSFCNEFIVFCKFWLSFCNKFNLLSKSSFSNLAWCNDWFNVFISLFKSFIWWFKFWVCEYKFAFCSWSLFFSNWESTSDKWILLL